MTTEGLLGKLNAYSGLWTLFVVVLTIVIFFFNIQSSLADLNKRHVGVTEIHREQIIFLGELTQSLKDLRNTTIRDLQYIKKQTEKQNTLIQESNRVLDRLSYILDRLEKRNQ